MPAVAHLDFFPIGKLEYSGGVPIGEDLAVRGLDSLHPPDDVLAASKKATLHAGKGRGDVDLAFSSSGGNCVDVGKEWHRHIRCGNRGWRRWGGDTGGDGRGRRPWLPCGCVPVGSKNPHGGYGRTGILQELQGGP